MENEFRRLEEMVRFSGEPGQGTVPNDYKPGEKLQLMIKEADAEIAKQPLSSKHLLSGQSSMGDKSNGNEQ